MKQLIPIAFCFCSVITSAQQKNIYQKGWIDFNKNGIKDVYEDPLQPIDKRVADLLSQMSLEEKTCQMATLYGYGRVLKDEMPTANWKNEIWKDGIANIDEGRTRVNGPLYPFGYGLSYTSFSYSNLIVTQKTPNAQSEIEVSVDITNTGKVKGDEVAQLYLKDVVSSVTTYESQLRGFERVSLNPGERKTVKFVLKPDDLALLDKDMNWKVEAGDFEIMVGSSSVDIRQRKKITVK
ncbi:MAG: hypothetical protein EOP48_19990 [Sphingobacteriales bacterium]|nr:MAG: hypothetical protein EOP48_19990 [Sphingobacteriales bacterium]